MSSEIESYRKIVEQMWTDGRIDEAEYASLCAMRDAFGLTGEAAEAIEREVLGMSGQEALAAGTPSAPPPPPGDTLSGLATLLPPAPSAATPVGDADLSGATVLGSDAGASPSTLGAQGAGALIQNRFQVIKVLGTGGMGQVMQVKDTRMGELRALKMVHPTLANRADIGERLKKEVLVCQRLRHPGIVQVFDFDVDDQTGAPFFTMEYMDGVTLTRWLKSRRGDPLSLEEFQQLATALCEALDHAHGKGVIHLDLKPDNIMVSADLSAVRIMDFGISRLSETTHLQTALAGAGTPYYIAPEQERREQGVDGRADIFALGAIFYEVLTGTPPRGRVKPIHELREDISQRISDVIDRAFAPDRDDRPANMAELLSALRADIQPALAKVAEDDRRLESLLERAGGHVVAGEFAEAIAAFEDALPMAGAREPEVRALIEESKSLSHEAHVQSELEAVSRALEALELEDARGRLERARAALDGEGPPELSSLALELERDLASLTAANERLTEAERASGDARQDEAAALVDPDHEWPEIAALQERLAALRELISDRQGAARKQLEAGRSHMRFGTWHKAVAALKDIEALDLALVKDARGLITECQTNLRQERADASRQARKKRMIAASVCVLMAVIAGYYFLGYLPASQDETDYNSAVQKAEVAASSHDYDAALVAWDAYLKRPAGPRRPGDARAAIAKIQQARVTHAREEEFGRFKSSADDLVRQARFEDAVDAWTRYASEVADPMKDRAEAASLRVLEAWDQHDYSRARVSASDLIDAGRFEDAVTALDSYLSRPEPMRADEIKALRAQTVADWADKAFADAKRVAAERAQAGQFREAVASWQGYLKHPHGERHAEQAEAALGETYAAWDAHDYAAAQAGAKKQEEAGEHQAAIDALQAYVDRSEGAIETAAARALIKGLKERAETSHFQKAEAAASEALASADHEAAMAAWEQYLEGRWNARAEEAKKRLGGAREAWAKARFDSCMKQGGELADRGKWHDALQAWRSYLDSGVDPDRRRKAEMERDRILALAQSSRFETAKEQADAARSRGAFEDGERIWTEHIQWRSEVSALARGVTATGKESATPPEVERELTALRSAWDDSDFSAAKDSSQRQRSAGDYAAATGALNAYVTSQRQPRKHVAAASQLIKELDAPWDQSDFDEAEVQAKAALARTDYAAADEAWIGYLNRKGKKAHKDKADKARDAYAEDWEEQEYKSTKQAAETGGTAKGLAAIQSYLQRWRGKAPAHEKELKSLETSLRALHSVETWAIIVKRQPDASVVKDRDQRRALEATGLPWQVKHKQSGIVMLLVAPGKFTMGSPERPGSPHLLEGEETAKKVTISRAFYLGQHEVSNEQWNGIELANPSEDTGGKKPVQFRSRTFHDPDERPLISDFLSKSGLRLPTEKEWEFACRSGSTRTPSTSDIRAAAWFKEPDRYGTVKRTRNVAGGYSGLGDVATRAPNAWGFFDMMGNVLEMVTWTPDPNRIRKDIPTQPLSTFIERQWSYTPDGCIMKGGYWNGDIEDCYPWRRMDFYRVPAANGLRVARDP